MHQGMVLVMEKVVEKVMVVVVKEERVMEVVEVEEEVVGLDMELGLLAEDRDTVLVVVTGQVTGLEEDLLVVAVEVVEGVVVEVVEEVPEVGMEASTDLDMGLAVEVGLDTGKEAVAAVVVAAAAVVVEDLAVVRVMEVDQAMDRDMVVGDIMNPLK